MDQFKHFLRIVKRQHFWALSLVVVLISTAIWFWTVRSLGIQRTENLGTIQESYSKVQRVRAIPDHKNDNTNEAMTNLIALRQAEVREAWDSKYSEQSAGGEGGGKNILEWPEELNDWNAELIPCVQQYWPIPIEADSELEDIKRHMLQDYTRYIKSELPKLATRIGAVWAPDLGGTVGGIPDEEEEEPRATTALSPQETARRTSSAVVHWNPQDQEALQTQHFDWRLQEGRLPTPLQMLYAQEDLWVLTALVEIIGRTNGNATVRHNARIREIESIKMGRNVGGRTGRVVRPGTDPASIDPELGSVAMEEDTPTTTGVMDEDGLVQQVDPLDMRYVDRDYNPMSADGVRSAADAYLRVAKRMPIRIRLRMNQLDINRLLSECANSPLTVEVRQVRVNPDDAGRGMGGRFGMFLNQDEFAEPFNPGRGRSLPGFGRGDEMSDMAFPNDVTVEIYGIIYIYNPVDEDLLRTDAVTGDFAST